MSKSSGFLNSKQEFLFARFASGIHDLRPTAQAVRRRRETSLSITMRVSLFASIVALFPLALSFPSLLRSTTVSKRVDTWGGSVSLGPTKSTIINAVTTIIPGTAPTTQNGELFLWPGMSNGTGDLVQTTLESWPDNSWCGATKGQWCVRASLFGSFGQLDGSASAVSGNTQVKIVYNLESDQDTWTQYVLTLGCRQV